MRRDTGGHTPPRRPAGGKGRKKPDAFDEWLRRGLHRIYDPIASEPIPQELLDLIEHDRQSKPDGKKDD